MIPILEKSIEVVRAVAGGAAGGSMSRLARELHIAPASCYRILQTLERADWVRPRAGGGFELSAGLLGLIHPVSNVERLVEVLAGPLTDLAGETQLAVKLSVREDRDAVTVYRAESPRAMALASRSGARFPLLIGSSGAVLCSDLGSEALERLIATADETAWQFQTPDQCRERVARARRERLCFDAGSFHPQVYTLSGPLLDASGAVVAAVTLIGLPNDLNDGALPLLRRQLTEGLDLCHRRIATPAPAAAAASARSREGAA